MCLDAFVVIARDDEIIHFTRDQHELASALLVEEAAITCSLGEPESDREELSQSLVPQLGRIPQPVQ